jgi:hypothetical protein
MVDFILLSSVSRTYDPFHCLIPALKRWAIFTASAVADDLPTYVCAETKKESAQMGRTLVLLRYEAGTISAAAGTS